jgi:hypothetical protein
MSYEIRVCIAAADRAEQLKPRLLVVSQIKHWGEE